MGLTQHKQGVQNVQMLANLLLLRGNIGKPGAGICPVRGHSNVQGQRTVGITEKPELVPLDKLEEQYGFEPPRDKGLDTVEACDGILDGSVRAFVSLGGNFVRAVPETDAHGAGLAAAAADGADRHQAQPQPPGARRGRLPPALPRAASRSTGRPAASRRCRSRTAPAACTARAARPSRPPPRLLSEPAIVAGIAKATLAPNPTLDWDAWVGDYA